MTTEELYIEAGPDFRELLGHKDAIAMIAGDKLFYFGEHGKWSFAGAGCTPAHIAVAAMTESWRERLEEKHGLYFYRERNNPRISPLRWLAESKQHGNAILAGADFLPEAIVAAVKWLAAEQRAKAAPAKLPNGGFVVDMGTGRDSIVIQCRAPADKWIYTMEAAAEEKVREIVREELNAIHVRAAKPKTD